MSKERLDILEFPTEHFSGIPGCARLALTEIEDAAVQHVVDTLGTHDEDMAGVLRLERGSLLCRTFGNRDRTTFVFVNPATPQEFMHFRWSLDFFWRHFGFAGPGGCCPPQPQEVAFRCVPSSGGAHVIITGPPELPEDQMERCHELVGRSYATTKIFSVEKREVQVWEGCLAACNTCNT